MPYRPIVLMGLMVLTAPAFAQVFDDTGLTGGAKPDDRRALEREAGPAGRFSARPVPGPAWAPLNPGQIGGTVLILDGQGQAAPGGALSVLLYSQGKLQGRTVTDAAGRWAMKRPAQDYSLRARLENDRWSIRDPKTRKPYEWEISTGTVRLDAGAASAKIALIHQQYAGAFAELESAGVDLSFWSRSLTVHYPGSGDYFTSTDFAVHLTRAEAWDVNLHELGHAVLSAGTRSYGGGGYHRITQCYNEGLAWSEGFATFLAGVARLDSGDKDPRFQYLAGGIALENVPSTVCKGETNEWRVAAALWDVYDKHADQEDSKVAFKKIWESLEGKSMGGFSDAWPNLRASLDPKELPDAETAVRNNTLTPKSPAVAGGKGAREEAEDVEGGRFARPELRAVLAAPDFDRGG